MHRQGKPRLAGLVLGHCDGHAAREDRAGEVGERVENTALGALTQGGHTGRRRAGSRLVVLSLYRMRYPHDLQRTGSRGLIALSELQSAGRVGGSAGGEVAGTLLAGRLGMAGAGLAALVAEMAPGSRCRWQPCSMPCRRHALRAARRAGEDSLPQTYWRPAGASTGTGAGAAAPPAAASEDDDASAIEPFRSATCARLRGAKSRGQSTRRLEAAMAPQAPSRSATGHT